MEDEKNIYKDLYYKLYNSISDVINILEKVQNETTQIFLDNSSPKDFKKHISSIKEPDSKRYFFY
ncbi:MAG: hypothetical protein IJE62_04100 [Clostridia bacterium]|nr:hypothetical protein [Clostridia bacterium]